MKIVIRAALESDLVAVAALLSQLGYPMTPEELGPHFKTLLRLGDLKVFLAELDGSALVGLISLVRMPSIRLNGFQVCIEEMVVDSAHRGKGVGGRLLDFAQSFARDQGAVMLEVLTNRKRESFQRKFYEKHGFVQSHHAVLRLELRNGRKTID